MDVPVLSMLLVDLIVVDRIVAKSERSEMYMQLDVNAEIYPIKVGEKFSVALSTTLSTDGTPDTGYYTPVRHYTLSILDVASLKLVFEWCRLEVLWSPLKS